MNTRNLILIFGDQLTRSLSSLQGFDKAQDHCLMCEVAEEANTVKHHKKKLAFLFSAMRHFAQDLKSNGYPLDYVELEDKNNTGSFEGELLRAITRHKPKRLILCKPSEYRVQTMVDDWYKSFTIDVEQREDNRFLCNSEEFANWAEGRKQLRMEYFYREMRKKYSILVEDNQPIGGQWNYDSENRKPPKSGLDIPPTYQTSPDEITQAVIKMVDLKFKDHFGDLLPFHYAVTRRQALAALTQFIEQRLPQFGDYQDAMLEGEAWMYHSHIGLYLNCGLLTPLECAQKAEQAYYDKQAPLNAVEGFIRQIIGWREFVRGIYWLKMPEYESLNFFNAQRKLPALFWGSETKMNCLSQCVKETKENAYAHHIQRLMVLGNFSLLAGLHPDEVNEWYLIVYADAFHWVELPNVSGMVLFADGGVLASKPYAASGSYINKMSNYCKGCEYKVREKSGPDACPFNYLYWDFLIRNKSLLEKNPRLAMPYRTLGKMTDEKRKGIVSDSRVFLKSLD